jgi:hypothetical protein
MGELLNLIGLSAGVVLYTVLLVMVVRAGQRHRGAPRFDALLLVSAMLGLVWNLCALAAYVLPRVGIAGPFPLLGALGFSALGLLPAVVVHSVLRDERYGIRGRTRRIVAFTAYVMALIAASAQVAAAAVGHAVPSAFGMRLLTYAFVALIVPLAMVTRGQPGARRVLWVAALATFAVSALHLSQLHRSDTWWPVELLGHHASVPLAFALLYQDYPFALADLFLKRALALLALATFAFGSVLLFSNQSAAFAHVVQLAPREIGALLAGWVAITLLYPTLRHWITWFVDAVVLHRPDYRALRATLARRLQSHDDVPLLLDEVCALLAPALSARTVHWREWHGESGDERGELVLVGDAARQKLLRGGHDPTLE